MRRSINLVGLFLVMVVALGMSLVPSSSQASSTQQALAITSVEINQVLGRQYLNARNFVAGKNTIIRAYLNQKITVDYDTQGVMISRNGTLIADLGPNDSTVPTNVLTFACPTRADCGAWQAGNYSFEVYIGNVTAPPTTAVFRTRQTLRVLAVPVKANYGNGVIKRVVGTAWKVGANFTRRVYPVAADGLKYTIGKELDGSAYDLSTDEGQEDLWSALTRLQPQVCAQNPRGPTCYEKIIGFIPDNVPLPGDNLLQGYTLGPPANVVVASDQDMPATVAHEIGHNYLLGDEYNDSTGQFNCAVNPTPPTYVGVDFTGKINGPIRCTTSTEVTWPAAKGGTGVLIRAATAFPYEVGGRGPLADSMAFMGSGTLQANMWISQRQYAQLFSKLAPVPVRLTASSSAADVRYVDAAGFIGVDGTIRLEPWYTFEDISDPITDTDDFEIQALDAGGKVLAREPFFVDFSVPDRDEELESAPFEVAVEYPPETTAFRIKNYDETLITVPVTANAPEVTITSPTAGQTVSGLTTITWEGSDSDGDTLLYDVEYSYDCENDFITLATSLTETSWEDDFSTLPGGEQACIWVTATDGINSTDADSDDFRVAAQAPEAYIETPIAGASFTAGERIPLAGSGYDPQDQDLLDEQLSWSSDKDGPLGNGTLIYPRLSAGTHTITLTATNSLDMTGTTTVEISMVAPEQKHVVFSPFIMR